MKKLPVKIQKLAAHSVIGLVGSCAIGYLIKLEQKAEARVDEKIDEKNQTSK